MKLQSFDYEFIERDLGPRFVDLDGNPVKRTPFTDPYTFDEHVIWKSEEFVKQKSNVVYSDRMMSRDFDKFSRCCQEAFSNTGQFFDNRPPEETEKFLRLYLGKNVKLTAITKCCNQATGYPIWVFYYESED